MSEKRQIIDELKRIYDGDAWHGDSLGTILKGISADQALAKPIAQAHSIWEIVLHISAWNETFTARLKGQSLAEPVDGDFPEIPERNAEAWQQALERLTRSQKLLLEAISEQDEAGFSKQFGDREYTLSFFLHGIVRHIVYHSGQIGLLKKASTAERLVTSA